MAKIRGFKPDLWTDEDFVEVGPFARLLWMGMWSYACDNGHLADKSKQIKMRVLPTDEVNCADLLRELEGQGLIERANGWVTIPNLTRHQKVDRRYFTTCEKPGCDSPTETVSQRESRRAPAVHTQGARGAHDVPTSGALGDGEVMVKGSDGDKSSSPTSTSPKSASRKRPAKRLPDDWEPNDKAIAHCAEKGIDLAGEVHRFRLHAEANDRRQANWDASFRMWLMNARPSNVHQLPQKQDTGWFQPFTMPPAPPEVEDDPEAYEAWAEGRRQAWRNGERW